MVHNIHRHTQTHRHTNGNPFTWIDIAHGNRRTIPYCVCVCVWKTTTSQSEIQRDEFTHSWILSFSIQFTFVILFIFYLIFTWINSGAAKGALAKRNSTQLKILCSLDETNNFAQKVSQRPISVVIKFHFRSGAWAWAWATPTILCECLVPQRLHTVRVSAAHCTHKAIIIIILSNSRAEWHNIDVHRE